MATSGYKDVVATYTTSGKVGDTLRFSWSQNGEQSIENNETPIKWSLLLIAGSAGYISSSASKAWNVTVNGTPYSGTNTIGIANNATKTLASGTTTIAHNSDGTKTFAVSFSQVFNITFNSYVGTVSGAANFTLDTIPRATTPTLSPTTVVMGEELKITLPRATDSFTHTLQHDFYVGSWTNFATGVETETTFETPESWASGIPNATTGNGRIRCLTYNGSTLIGEKIVDFKATVPTSMIPTVNSITVSEGSEGLAAKFGAFIQSKSKLRVVSKASGIQGSTISSYKVEILDVSYNGADITTDYILKSGTIAVKTTVTDSRGRKGSKTVNVTLLEYYTPTITDFSAFRADADGNASNKGTSLKCLFDFKIAPCGDKNDKSYTIQYKKTTASTYTVLTTDSGYYTLDSSYLKTEILAIESAYDVQIVLKDYFSEATYTLRVGSKIVPIAVYPNGKGMGVFGYPTREALQVFGETEFPDKVLFMDIDGEGTNIDARELLINLNMITDYVVEEATVPEIVNNTSNLWHYRKWNSGQCEIWYRGYHSDFTLYSEEINGFKLLEHTFALPFALADHKYAIAFAVRPESGAGYAMPARYDPLAEEVKLVWLSNGSSTAGYITIQISGKWK